MIAVVDYKAGNLTSVRLALEAIGQPCIITPEPEKILASDRVIFPGVGAAGAAMRTLRSTGIAEAIAAAVKKGIPTLGICLGTQIVFDRSEEDGGVECLGIIEGCVKKFKPESHWDKVPQMGWNRVSHAKSHPILEGIENNSEFYFVHSYYPSTANPETVLAQTTYAGVAFASVVTAGSLAATQFHPEKSGRVGLRLLSNFCGWNPVKEIV